MQKDLMVSRVIQFPNTSHKLGIRHSANSNNFLAKNLVLQNQTKTKHTCTHTKHKIYAIEIFWHKMSDFGFHISKRQKI